MKAVSPVLPSYNTALSGALEVDLSQGSSCYLPLPAILGTHSDTMRTVRFRLTWGERIRLFLTGNLWAQQLTFGRNYPPVKLLVKEPTPQECE